MGNADETVVKNVVFPDSADAGSHACLKITIQTRLRAVGFLMVEGKVLGLGHQTLYASAAAEYRALLCVMHMKGTARDMQKQCVYENLLSEICSFLRSAAETAQEAGGCTTEAQGETAQPETAGESEPDDQTTEGDSGTDAWNQAPITEASAGRRGPQVQNSVITSLETLLKDGSGPVGDVEQWQVFRLNAKFNLPDLMVHEGDTTVITLPEKLKFNQTTEFDIKTGDGNVVAHAVIDGGTKTITLTYTDYAENHSDVSGSFFFYVQMDRDKVDGEETIPLTIDVSGNTVSGGDIHFKGIGEPQKSTINKSGWQLSDLSNGDHTTLQYQLLVNTAGQAIQSEPV